MFFYPGADREFTWRDGVGLILAVGTFLPSWGRAEQGDQFFLSLPAVIILATVGGALAGWVWGDWHVAGRIAAGAITGLVMSLIICFAFAGRQRISKAELALVLSVSLVFGLGIGYSIHRLLYVPEEFDPRAEEEASSTKTPTANIDPLNPPPKLSWDFLKKPDEEKR
jgi:hypothetical protein